MILRFSSKVNVSLYHNTLVKTLAYEIAEPRPDMNIKVAAFAVSEKPINTICIESSTYTINVP